MCFMLQLRDSYNSLRGKDFFEKLFKYLSVPLTKLSYELEYSA